MMIEFTWHGFVAGGVRDANEALEQHGVFLMIPVAEKDGEFLVVLIGFVGGMQQQGCT